MHTAGRQLQVFNIGTKQKLKAHLMNEEIVFWKWISSETLGIVTETAVWHWSLTTDTPPIKVSSCSYLPGANQEKGRKR